jgi:KUP system potassium uptake protein
MSDGVLTPAQSILGSVQGLSVVNPNIGQPAIIGITCGILIFLFAIQPFGVSKIGMAFAPIVIVWLLFNFCFGVYNLVHHDHSVLKAFSPYFAGMYFVRNKTTGWKSLGGILLSFTGVEALFADLGAFSKSAIQLSWLCLVYPCLLMAYIGQAAFISRNPSAYSNPFFNAAPPGTFWPAFIVSILATIVASQALITSTFQLLFQCINMSYFPPISYRYTSVKYHSQIFIPMANWTLMVGTIVVTAVFKDTTKLGNAYGVCVILDTVVTTSLVSLVAVIVWRIKWYFVLPVWLTYATFEGLYLSSALTKVPDGAWFTLTVAVCLAIIFTTWRLGKEKQWVGERKGRMRLNRLISKGPNDSLTLSPGLGGGEIVATKGIGIFFDKAGGHDFVPIVYEEFLRKFESQPALQVFLHLRATTVPFVPDEERYAVTRTGLPNCYRMIIRYGYSEQAVSPQLGRVVYDELKKYILALGKKPMPNSGTTPALSSEPSQAATEKTVVPSEDDDEGASSAIDANGDAQDAQATEDQDIIDRSIASRLAALDAAYRSQTIYVFGKEELVLPEKRYNLVKRFFLGAFLWMRDSTGEKVTSLRIPMNKVVEIGFVKEI